VEPLSLLRLVQRVHLRPRQGAEDDAEHEAAAAACARAGGD